MISLAKNPFLVLSVFEGTARAVAKMLPVDVPATISKILDMGSLEFG
jgi:hypothetical protein